MRLCLAFGYPVIHPEILDRLMTERQMNDWCAFYEIEPWGEPVWDERIAQLTWASAKTARPANWLMKWGPQDVFKLTPDEYRAKRDAVMARAGADQTMKQVSSLSVALFANVGNLVAGFHQGEQAAGSMISKIEAIGAAVTAALPILAVLKVAMGGISEIGKGFELAAQFETAQVQLTALTGSAGIAHSLLGQLRDFAKTSPFEFPEIEQATKKMLSMGVAAGSVTPLLKKIGEVSAGTGTPLDEIADIFARVKEEGSLSERELRQFTRAGVPLEETLRMMGLAGNAAAAGMAHITQNIGGASAKGQHLQKAMDLVQGSTKKAGDIGAVSFGQLVQAFDLMTSKGGRFNGILEAQSHTLGGEWKRLRGTIDDQLANVGEAISTAFDIPGILGKLSSFVDGAAAVFQRLATLATPYIQEMIAIFGKAMDFASDEWEPFAEQAISALAVIRSAFTNTSGWVERLGDEIGEIGAIIADTFGQGSDHDIQVWASKVDALTKQLDESFVDSARNAIQSLKGVFQNLPTPPQFNLPVGLDPDTLKLNIEPHLGKIVYAGSAEAQALRFAAKVSPAGGGGGASLIPPGNGSYTPSSPSVGGVASTTADNALSNAAQLAELKTANQTLNKIELNTRGATGTGAVVFSLN